MKTCRVCGRTSARRLLDFGPQPICNRYLASPEQPEFVHPLALAVCQRCGVLQIEQPPPADELRPRGAAVAYNEPESHLDQVADILTALPNITPTATFCGMSYKDDSTLRRVRQRGMPQTWLAEMRDLGIDAPEAGIESLQDCLTLASAARLSEINGRPQILLARHVLEHAHDVHRLTAALRQLVAPDGYVLFEVPDARRALERRDYSTIWEEHVFYFTPLTLRNCLEACGFEIVRFEKYPYALQDVLVAIARPRANPAAPASFDSSDVTYEVERASGFANAYGDTCAEYQAFFDDQRRHARRVALLGAGHLSCAFLNLLRLANYMEFVVDDNAAKQGRYMPGSRLPIRGSAALLATDIRLCCLGVRPEVEEEVIERNAAFIARGGVFASIFPGSRYALPIKRGAELPASQGAAAA